MNTRNIADLSDGRLADQRFVAMSREYMSCVFLLTQSMSAMLGGANDSAGMESLIANCNTRIVFYTFRRRLSRFGACGSQHAYRVWPRMARRR